MQADPYVIASYVIVLGGVMGYLASQLRQRATLRDRLARGQASELPARGDQPNAG